jgi:hypothetical protein
MHRAVEQLCERRIKDSYSVHLTIDLRLVPPSVEMCHNTAERAEKFASFV